MTLPEVRHCLHVIANLIADEGLSEKAAILHYLAEETRRRPPAHRAPAKPHKRVSKQMVINYFNTHPNDGYMEAAVALGVKNIGRISEIYRGFRV